MKNKNISISPAALKKAFYSFMHRFHVMVFVIVVLGGMAVTVFLLNAIVIQSGDTTEFDAGGTSTSFDQATIKRIDELKTRNQDSNTLDLSKGRANPFVE